MNRNTHTGSFWKGKGFYLVLGLVVAGAALVSWVSVSNMIQSLTKQTIPKEDTTWGVEDTQDAETKQQNVPVPSVAPSAQPSAVSSPSPSPTSCAKQEEPAAWQPAQTRSYAWPMAGSEQRGFSADELVFDDTMQDWRTHNGLDLAGSLGREITAPAACTVVAAYADAQWGGVTELDCGDVTVRLCGVQDMAVHEGDTLTAGQAVGVLGAVPAESAAEVHLHIEVLEDGAYVDPAGFFAS